MSTSPPIDAPVRLPPLIRDKVRHDLYAIPGPELRFRVVRPDSGLSGEGATPEAAYAALQGKDVPADIADRQFLGWLLTRSGHDGGHRMVQRAVVETRARDKHGAFAVRTRDPDWSWPEEARSIPVLWGGTEVYLRPGLGKGELVVPRLAVGAPLALYLQSGAHTMLDGAAWADLFHDADPIVPLLRHRMAGAAFRECVRRELPWDALLQRRSGWRPTPPTEVELRAHIARSATLARVQSLAGVGVWGFRRRKGGEMSVRAHALIRGDLVSMRMTRPGTYTLDHLGLGLDAGEWRPLHPVTLAPVRWPQALEPGAPVLVFDDTTELRRGKRARYVGALKGSDRTSVAIGPRGFDVPSRFVHRLPGPVVPFPATPTF